MTGAGDRGDRGADADAHQRAAAVLADHLTGVVANEPWVQHVEHDASIPRWYVRFGCDTRDAATIYFDLHQRSLHYEIYFLPDSGTNREALYRFALHRNHTTMDAHYSVGPDGDLYLTGRCLVEHLDAAALDRIIGTLYQITERDFPTVVQLAYGRSPT